MLKQALHTPDFVVAQLAEVDPLEAFVLLARIVCRAGSRMDQAVRSM